MERVASGALMSWMWCRRGVQRSGAAGRRSGAAGMAPPARAERPER